MGTGLNVVLAFFGTAVFAMAARRREAFGILGVCSLLTGLFYGWVWLLERKAIRLFQEKFGDMGIYPADHLPRGWHSIVMEFELHVLIAIWGLGMLLFVSKFISDLAER